MKLLISRAYLGLLLFDLYVARDDFAGLYKKVRSCPIKTGPTPSDGIEQIRSAVDMACVWYWKEVLCLQRSAATAYLLKQFGASAQLVIGAQQIPFKAHAWVEIDGRVVNDNSYVREMYAVLDRC
jgi:Transglutaminase-like superfamily